MLVQISISAVKEGILYPVQILINLRVPYTVKPSFQVVNKGVLINKYIKMQYRNFQWRNKTQVHTSLDILLTDLIYILFVYLIYLYM